MNPIECFELFEEITSNLNLHRSCMVRNNISFAYTDLGMFYAVPVGDGGYINTCMHIKDGYDDVIMTHHIHIPAEALVSREAANKFIDEVNEKAEADAEEAKRKREEIKAKHTKQQEAARRAEYERLKAEFEPNK